MSEARKSVRQAPRGPLVEFVRLGFTTLSFWARGGAEQRERIAHEVLPLVRQAF